MLLPDESSIQFFLECWLPEFRNAIDMFTGRSFALSAELISAEEDQTEEANDSISMVTFKRNSSATLQIKVSQSVLVSLLESAASTVEERESLFQEMLDQSLTGAVFQMNTRHPEKVTSPISYSRIPGAETSIQVGDVCLRLFSPEVPDFVLLIRIREPEKRVFLPESLPAVQDELHQALLPGAERFSQLQMAVSVVLGHARVSAREVLKFTNGSVIELDRSMPDAIEVVVHGRVVARGEVVSVQGNYGIRIKELMSRNDRITLGQNVSSSGKEEVLQ